jgi:hypothetical protein
VLASSAGWKVGAANNEFLSTILGTFVARNYGVSRNDAARCSDPVQSSHKHLVLRHRDFGTAVSDVASPKLHAQIARMNAWLLATPREIGSTDEKRLIARRLLDSTGGRSRGNLSVGGTNPR